MTRLSVLILCAVVLILGCGQDSGREPANEPSLQNVRLGLQQIANGARPEGSLMMGIEMGIANLKKTDAPRAETLQKEIAELKTAPANQASAKAKQILDQLEPAK